MANFRTHVTTSIALGGAYGAVAHLQYGVPLPSATLAAGLCAIGGILPDIDSDNAVVLRESLGLVAAVTPLLTLDRLSKVSLPQETIVLFAALMYLGIRFVLGAILRHWTIHRGMWHSIPAAIIAGAVVFYLCACPESQMRVFKAGAIVLGYLWHLILDEIYAVESKIGRVRFKKSFGTAFKFWSPNPMANVFTYGLLVGVMFFVNHDWRLARDHLHFVNGPESSETVGRNVPLPHSPRYVPPVPR